MFDVLTPGTRIAGRYSVLRELGRGGMGAVYLVEHAHTGDQLALKVLLAHVGVAPAAVERFKREARTSALIKSENLVKITDADVAPELDSAPFLVMELLHGADFDKLVRTQGPLDPERVVSYLLQVGRAIDRAHQLGIVHRDLKPENLFLHQREDGETIVKVLDFGISKIVNPDGLRTSAGMTQTGVVMGTPLFMSPEQASGDSSVGPPADIWAIGLIAVFLLTGEVFWRASTLSQLILEIVVGKMPALSERFPGRLPAALDGWFARACDRVPEQRFRSVREQVEALALSLGLPDPSRLQRSPAPVPETISELQTEVLRTATTANPLSLSVDPAPRVPRRPSRARYALGGAALALAGGLAWGFLSPPAAVPVPSGSAGVSVAPPPPPPPPQSAVPRFKPSPPPPPMPSVNTELLVPQSEPRASAKPAARHAPVSQKLRPLLRPRPQPSTLDPGLAKPYQPAAP